MLHRRHEKSQVYLDGRVQKIVSILASMATVQFLQAATNRDVPINGNAYFDARAFSVTDKMRAVDALMDRERDTVRNSVSMLARGHFSHRELHNKHSGEMRAMLEVKGVRWEDLDGHLRRGTLYRRTPIIRVLTEMERQSIPAAHRPEPGMAVERHDIIEMPCLSDATPGQRVALIFGEEVA